MNGVSRFYKDSVNEISTVYLNEFFMDEISGFIRERTEGCFGKIGGAEPVTYDEFMDILDKGMEDETFNRHLILARLESFAANCKIKEASNQWILDYFYLSVIRQMFVAKSIDRLNKSDEFVNFINDNLDAIEGWLSKMRVTVEKRGLFGKGKQDADRSVTEINEQEYYREAMRITQNLFVLYHSVALGVGKSRDNIDYKFEIVADEIRFSDIDDMDKRDAVKATKLAKGLGRSGINLFMNMLSLYYIKICTS